MKGVTDKVITIIVSLILAVIALIIIWIFLSKSMPHITEVIQRFTCGMCKSILPDFVCGEC